MPKVKAWIIQTPQQGSWWRNYFSLHFIKKLPFWRFKFSRIHFFLNIRFWSQTPMPIRFLANHSPLYFPNSEISAQLSGNRANLQNFNVKSCWNLSLTNILVLFFEFGLINCVIVRTGFVISKHKFGIYEYLS